MIRYFVDTFYLIALAHPRDRWHGRALTFSQALPVHHLYTVDEVLTEFLAACSGSGATIRQRAARTVRQALSAPQWTVVPQTRTLFLEGLALYEARLDKEYSLTDCIAMQVMRREGLTEVLTNDHHFTQEGFHILFP
jgi:predicted nucleic acid-binding protein